MAIIPGGTPYRDPVEQVQIQTPVKKKPIGGLSDRASNSVFPESFLARMTGCIKALSNCIPDCRPEPFSMTRNRTIIPLSSPTETQSSRDTSTDMTPLSFTPPDEDLKIEICETGYLTDALKTETEETIRSCKRMIEKVEQKRNEVLPKNAKITTLQDHGFRPKTLVAKKNFLEFRKQLLDLMNTIDELEASLENIHPFDVREIRSEIQFLKQKILLEEKLQTNLTTPKLKLLYQQSGHWEDLSLKIQKSNRQLSPDTRLQTDSRDSEIENLYRSSEGWEHLCKTNMVLEEEDLEKNWRENRTILDSECKSLSSEVEKLEKISLRKKGFISS